VGPCPAIMAPGRRSTPACERGPEAASDLAAGTPVVARSFPHGGPTVGPDVKETSASSAFGRRPVAPVRRTRPGAPKNRERSRSRGSTLGGTCSRHDHVRESHCGPRSCCTPPPGDQAPPSSSNPVPEPSNPHPHGQDRSESPLQARLRRSSRCRRRPRSIRPRESRQAMHSCTAKAGAPSVAIIARALRPLACPRVETPSSLSPSPTHPARLDRALEGRSQAPLALLGRLFSAARTALTSAQPSSVGHGGLS
jgi:hypothetical protein